MNAAIPSAPDDGSTCETDLMAIKADMARIEADLVLIEAGEARSERGPCTLEWVVATALALVIIVTVKVSS